MKEFGTKKYYWQNGSYENLDIFQACINTKGLCLFYDSAYTGRSTPTTAFDGAMWHFVYTMWTHWTYAWRSLVHKSLLLTKWQLWELRQFFRLVSTKRGYACAIIVHTWANQLLPQLLMAQFDTLYTQCRHIEHMHEGVWFTKTYYSQNNCYKWELDNFSSLYWIGLMRKWQLLRTWQFFQLLLNRFYCLCYNRAYMGRSTPTTAFDGLTWYFVFTLQAHWTITWRSLMLKT